MRGWEGGCVPCRAGGNRELVFGGSAGAHRKGAGKRGGCVYVFARLRGGGGVRVHGVARVICARIYKYRYAVGVCTSVYLGGYVCVLCMRVAGRS